MDAKQRAEDLIVAYGEDALSAAKTGLALASVSRDEPAVAHWGAVLIVLSSTDLRSVQSRLGFIKPGSRL